MSGSNAKKAKFVLEEIGMRGSARAENSIVMAVSGGEDHIPEGAHVRRIGMEEQALAINSTVKASENRKIFVAGQAVDADRDDGSEAAGKSTLHFGHGDTAAILLAGAGEGSDTFKRDVKRMESLLISDRIGIRSTTADEPTHATAFNGVPKSCPSQMDDRADDGGTEQRNIREEQASVSTIRCPDVNTTGSPTLYGDATEVIAIKEVPTSFPE